MDIKVTGDFNATEMTFTAVSEAGKAMMSMMFGKGAVSCNVPKSKGNDLIVFFKQKGLVVS